MYVCVCVGVYLWARVYISFSSISFTLPATKDNKEGKREGRREKGSKDKAQRQLKRSTNENKIVCPTAMGSHEHTLLFPFLTKI